MKYIMLMLLTFGTMSCDSEYATSELENKERYLGCYANVEEKYRTPDTSTKKWVNFHYFSNKLQVYVTLVVGTEGKLKGVVFMSSYDNLPSEYIMSNYYHKTKCPSVVSSLVSIVKELEYNGIYEEVLKALKKAKQNEQ